MVVGGFGDNVRDPSIYSFIRENVKFYDLMYDGCLTEKVRRTIDQYYDV